jgi:hypothetical protein
VIRAIRPTDRPPGSEKPPAAVRQLQQLQRRHGGGGAARRRAPRDLSLTCGDRRPGKESRRPSPVATEHGGTRTGDAVENHRRTGRRANPAAAGTVSGGRRERRVESISAAGEISRRRRGGEQRSSSRCREREAMGDESTGEERLM